MVEPEKKERLTRKRESFQVRVTKRLKGEEVPTDEMKEEERTALGGLRGRGKHAKVCRELVVYFLNDCQFRQNWLNISLTRLKVKLIRELY